MDNFQSDFLKVSLLLIVLFSFTDGGQKEDLALKKCKDEMKAIFGLDKPLLKCVEEAINNFSDMAYREDVNEYYWRFYNYATAKHIELRVQFCQRLDEFMRRLINEENPNFEKCVESLKSFEDEDPPVVKKNIISIAPFQENDKEYELKEKILYNALYYHKVSFAREQPKRHTFGTYGAIYLESIKHKVALIDVLDNDFTPRKFCNEKHKPKENDIGTSILPK